MRGRGWTGVIGLVLMTTVIGGQPPATAGPAPPAVPASPAAATSVVPRDVVLSLQTALARLAHPVPLSGGVDAATTTAVQLLADKYAWPSVETVDLVVARRIIELARGVVGPAAACRGLLVLCVDQERLLLLVVDHDRIVERHDVRLGGSAAVNRPGAFRVTRKVASTVSTEYGALMTDALFFDGGRALHYSEQFARTGYAGTSHGCVNLRDAAVAHRLFVSTPVGTPVVVLADSHRATSAAELLATMRAAGLPRDARVSISVRDLTGGTVTGTDASIPVVAASNVKLLTAVAAVTVLGPRRRFTTRLRLAPGHRLLVVGGGDAGLDELDVARLAAEAGRTLRQRGIARVRISADVRAFRGVPRPVGWGRGVRGVDAGRLSALRIAGDPRGSGWARVLRVLRRELAVAGVVGRLEGRTTTSLRGPVIASHRGGTVADLVAGMLLRSENDTAEVLRAQVIRARGRDPRAVERAVASAGIRTTGVVLADGSGLSVRGRLTARTLTRLLVVLSDPGARPALRRLVGALPVAGLTGTLGPSSRRFLDPSTRCAAGRVAAKTGTLTGVSALSGYARDLGRHLVAFSILVSHPDLPRAARTAAVDAGAAAVVQCT